MQVKIVLVIKSDFDYLRHRSGKKNESSTFSTIFTLFVLINGLSVIVMLANDIGIGASDSEIAKLYYVA